MPAGPPLTQARRIAADSCPPLSLAPWIKSTCHGQECRVSVLLCPQEHFKEPCLGQAAPLVVAMEAILAACPLVVEVEAVAEGPCEGPWCHVMPRGSLSFQASPGGLLVPVGCPVLPVWPWRAFLSCFVLSCLFSPGGLLIPPHFPREFFLGGVVRVPAVGAGLRGPRPRPRSPSAMASWAPCTAMASRAPSSAMASVVCSALEVPVLCSCPCLSWGASRAPTPPPRWNCYGVGHAFREGGVMSGFCCVSCVPAACVHIWFVSCPRLMSLWVNSCPAVFVSLSVINLCILVHACSVWFRLVYSLLPGVSCL